MPPSRLRYLPHVLAALSSIGALVAGCSTGKTAVALPQPNLCRQPDSVCHTDSLPCPVPDTVSEGQGSCGPEYQCCDPAAVDGGPPPPACPGGGPCIQNSLLCPQTAPLSSGPSSCTTGYQCCGPGQYDAGFDAPGPPLPYQGSPLCGSPASVSACNPDETAGDAGAGSCQGQGDGDAAAPSDAGTARDGATDASATTSLACHVVPQGGSGGAVAPACLVGGAGQDGATCASGSDCAPGLECVGEPGTGVCRHYCCDNACPTGSSVPDGGDAGDAGNVGRVPFCDIEPMSAYPGNAVPVCVEEPSCTLFAPCATAALTCTIVDAQGTTACIPVGSQQVGESCEEAHCKAGLTCWGAFPNRTCQELCDATNSCPAGQACTSNTVNFPAPYTAGICTTPQ